MGEASPPTRLDPESFYLLFLSALSEQGDECLYLWIMDVLLQEFVVVVHESRDGVLCKYTVANLALHCPKKLVCYFLLRGRERATITACDQISLAFPLCI